MIDRQPRQASECNPKFKYEGIKFTVEVTLLIIRGRVSMYSLFYGEYFDMLHNILRYTREQSQIKLKTFFVWNLRSKSIVALCTNQIVLQHHKCYLTLLVDLNFSICSRIYDGWYKHAMLLNLPTSLNVALSFKWYENWAKKSDDLSLQWNVKVKSQCHCGGAPSQQAQLSSYLARIVWQNHGQMLSM